MVGLVSPRTKNIAKQFRSINTSKEIFGKQILTSIVFEPMDDYEILDSSTKNKNFSFYQRYFSELRVHLAR